MSASRVSEHGIGIVGLGVISRAYLDTLAGASGVRIVAVADIDLVRAAAVAETIPGAVALTPDELYASPEVDTVLNLTIPAAHEEVALAALAAGKNVYGEKPLVASLDGARRARGSRSPSRSTRTSPVCSATRAARCRP